MSDEVDSEDEFSDEVSEEEVSEEEAMSDEVDSDDDDDGRRKKKVSSRRESSPATKEPRRPKKARKRSALSEDEEEMVPVPTRPPAAPVAVPPMADGAESDEDAPIGVVAAAVLKAATAPTARAPVRAPPTAAELAAAEKLRHRFSAMPRKEIDTKVLPHGAFLVVGKMGLRATWQLPYKDLKGRVNVHLLEVARRVVQTGKTASGKKDVDFLIKDSVRAVSRAPTTALPRPEPTTAPSRCRRARPPFSSFLTSHMSRAPMTAPPRLGTLPGPFALTPAVPPKPHAAHPPLPFVPWMHAGGREVVDAGQAVA